MHRSTGAGCGERNRNNVRSACKHHVRTAARTAIHPLFLVGAAGFEPTTCSTQNCRATRLRYTPNIPWETMSIHACAATSKPPAAVSSAVEERMRHAVSRLDPVLFGRAGNHLEHPLRRPPRRDDLGRQRLGIFRNPEEPGLGPNGNY